MAAPKEQEWCETKHDVLLEVAIAGAEEILSETAKNGMILYRLLQANIGYHCMGIGLKFPTTWPALIYRRAFQQINERLQTNFPVTTRLISFGASPC